MVKAFFIHTLLPGRSTIVYSRWYGSRTAVTSEVSAPDLSLPASDTVSLSSRITIDPEKASLPSSFPEQSIAEEPIWPSHKQLMFVLAKEVQAQYGFRSSLSGRSYEHDLQRLNTDGILPDMEQGYFRHIISSADEDLIAKSSINQADLANNEKVVLWMGALNTGFTLVCHKHENRQLAERVLILLVKYLQEYCRAFNHPTDIIAKPDKVSIITDTFLPNGTLLFMTHRTARQFEKEMERKLKSV